MSCGKVGENGNGFARSHDIGRVQDVVVYIGRHKSRQTEKCESEHYVCSRRRCRDRLSGLADDAVTYQSTTVRQST